MISFRQPKITHQWSNVVIVWRGNIVLGQPKLSSELISHWFRYEENTAWGPQGQDPRCPFDTHNQFTEHRFTPLFSLALLICLPEDLSISSNWCGCGINWISQEHIVSYAVSSNITFKIPKFVILQQNLLRLEPYFIKHSFQNYI